MLNPLGVILQSHPHEHLQFGRQLPLTLGIALVGDRRSLEEYREYVTAQFTAAVSLGGEHDLVGGDAVVGYSPVTT